MIGFDIETASDNLIDYQDAWFTGKKKDKRLVDPSKIDANLQSVREKFPLDPLTGKVILIGIVSDSDIDGQMKFVDGIYYKQLGLNDTDERTIINDFWKLLSIAMNRGHRAVSFNGKSFDVPFLFGRSIFLNCERPNTLRMIDALRSKYNTTTHVDLFHAFNESGTQSEWANKLNPDESISSDGHLIPRWYESGEYQAILDKNLMDLKQMFLIYKRVESWI